MARVQGLAPAILTCGLVSWLSLTSLGYTAPPPAAQAQPEWPSPVVMLIRDSAVQAELALSPGQVAQVDAAVQAVDRELWVLRDVPPADGIPRQEKLVAQVSAALKTALEPKQRQRFDQLLIQARGVGGLARPSVAKRLGLSGEQLEQLRAIQGETAVAVAELKKQAGENVSAALNEQLAKLQADSQKRQGEVLSTEQRQRLGALVGRPFEFSKLKRIAAQAPDFVGVQEWVNGPPRTLGDVRGKVIALHFFAFG